jgi:phage terminase large subunit-like protein
MPRLKKNREPVAPATRSEAFFNFCKNALTHQHGPSRGRPFILEQWQMERIIRPLYDTVNPDGLRQYRTCFIEIGRKNGKSFLASAVALFELLCMGEPGAQVISAAGTREQASLTFDVARKMVLANPQLAGNCRIFKNVIESRAGGIYRTVSAEAFSAHGLNISCCIFDEVWVQKSPLLYEALTTSMGARKQPLNFMISTSGFDKESLAYRLHSYAQKVAEGVVEDKTFLPVLFGAPMEADWKDPAVWRLANPNLGVSVSEEFLANACKEAQENPAQEIPFRQLFLSQWVTAESRWLPIERLENCEIAPEEWPDFAHEPAWCGIDLSSTTDLTSFAAVWLMDGKFWVKTWSWAPRGVLKSREKSNKTRYDNWERSGDLFVTDGDAVDYMAIRNFVLDFAEKFRIESIAFDRWNSSALVTELQNHGINCVGVGQGFASMNPAVRGFEAKLLSDRLRFYRNPVFKWAFSNVVLEHNPAGDSKPSKKASREKIDPVVAALMALTKCDFDVAEQSAGNYSSLTVI